MYSRTLFGTKVKYYCHYTVQRYASFKAYELGLKQWMTLVPLCHALINTTCYNIPRGRCGYVTCTTSEKTASMSLVPFRGPAGSGPYHELPSLS